MKPVAFFPSLFPRLSALLGLALILLTGPAVASRPAAGSLEGLWKGRLAVPGGQAEVTYRLTKAPGGDYAGTLDVPAQQLSHVAVRVRVLGDSVRLLAEEAGSRFEGLASVDSRQIAGTWHQNGLHLPMTLAFSGPLAVPPARPARPYREEEVGFSNRIVRTRLQGALTLPPGAGPFPAVILLSDAGLQDRNGTVGGFAPLGLLADFLTRQGVAVLRFDDRGIGSSPGPAATSPADLVGDVQAAMYFLRSRPEIDIAHLGLIGHGEGGNVALLTAAQPLPPAFVVALAPYGLTGYDLVLQQQVAMQQAVGAEAAQVEEAVKRQQALLDVIRQTPDNAQAQAIVANVIRQQNPAIDQATAQSSAAELTTATYRAFLAFNPVAKLASVTCPVLLLNGLADLTVSAETNLTALTKALRQNRNVLVKRLPGVNHQFQADPEKWPVVKGQPQPTFSPEALEVIGGWVAEQNK